MFPLERMIAGRYLRAKRKEGFISVVSAFSFLGIMLGVAVLIVVMSVMNGFRDDLMGRILGINGHFAVSSYAEPLTEYNAITEKIATAEDVVFVAPVVEGQVMLARQGRAQGVMVRAQTLDKLQSQPLLSEKLKLSDVAAFQSGRGIVVGERLAQTLGLRVGDKVTMVSPKMGNTVFGVVPRLKNYIIAGTFNVGMYEYDSSFVYMSLSQGQKFFQKKNTINYIQVITKDADQVYQTINTIRPLIPETASVRTWQDSNGALANALDVERNVMMLILTLIVVVAAFNVVSGQIMLVNDKNRSIAILRTVGASRGTVMGIFLMTGSVVGIVGTFFGGILGITLANNIQSVREFLENISGGELFAAEIYFLSKLPSRIDFSEVAFIIITALIISILASIYPAYKASKTDPAEVLRHD